VDATDGIVALDLEGEFDIDGAPGLLDHVERVLAAGKDLIVNLSGATFIDSSIVHTLFQAAEDAKRAGRVFVLQFGTHAAVERVLSITGADKHLDTAPTRQEAVELVEQLGAESDRSSF
jgi:anti-sigma B factor antagonist